LKSKTILNIKYKYRLLQRPVRRVAGNGAMSAGTCKGKIPAYQGDVRGNEKM